MDESSSLTIDETASNNSSENSQHASEMSMGKRPWTSGNFEVIEVFEDEAQLNEWLKNPGGGNNDWIIECNRETRTHRVTELICRRSQKYSSRQKSSVSYSCQARLRIRRPLPDRTEMDQSIIVEKTAIDHDHEPKDNGFERHNGSRDVEHTISMAEEEDGDKVTEADNAERERGDEVEDGNNAEGERDDEIENGRKSKGSDERNSVEIAADAEQASVEGEQEQKTEFNGKQEEKTDGRKSVEIAADAEGSSIKEEEQGDTEFMSLMEVDKKEPSEEKSEFIQEVDTSILSIPTSTTANMMSNRRESSSQEQIMTSGPTTRPKRNRTRRLFTPSPPPRLGGEPKRKKEMSDDSFSKEPSTTPSMQNVLVGKKIPWAKEQPRQSHSVHSMSTALIPSTSSLHEKRIGLAKPSSSQSNTKFISVSSSSVHNLPPQTTTTLPNINLQAQNDKWTRENLQLKRQNQEQQQQIQALISANRELIWAFNESRREHDELMKQLRLLTNTNDGGHVNGNGSGGGGSSNRARAAITTAGTAASSAHPKAGIAKRISGGAGQTQQRRPQNRGKSSMVFNNMSANSLPPSLAILNKAQKQSASQTFARKPKSRSASGSGKSTNEQLLANVKCEIDEQMEHGNTPPGTATQKLSREEKIAQIKEQLENLPLDLETSKLLGNRRPAFFTPTEFGDWHSVVSGDLRKQLVLQIFQALCPEIGQNIEEYIKIYPSRSDYFRKSVEFAFNAENEVFVAAPSRDDYFRTLADKIFTLRESASRFASGNGRADEREKRNPQQSKRTLADVLKKRSRPPDEEKEEEEEDEPITED